MTGQERKPEKTATSDEEKRVAQARKFAALRARDRADEADKMRKDTRWCLVTKGDAFAEGRRLEVGSSCKKEDCMRVLPVNEWVEMNRVELEHATAFEERGVIGLCVLDKGLAPKDLKVETKANVEEPNRGTPLPVPKRRQTAVARG